MKKLILFYLPDCNVSNENEERLYKALALPEFAGRFNLIRHNLYTDTGRQEARSVGISDAPTVYCNGDILRGVQSDYTIRKYLRIDNLVSIYTKKTGCLNFNCYCD